MSSSGSQVNISFSSRFMALMLRLGCTASALSFRTRVEVSQSFKMLSHKEEILAVLLLLFHCLLSGTPQYWSEKQWSCLSGAFKPHAMPGGPRSKRPLEQLRLNSSFRKYSLCSKFRCGFIETLQHMLKSINFKHKFAIRAYVLWSLLLEDLSPFPDWAADKLFLHWIEVIWEWGPDLLYTKIRTSQ